MHVDKCHHTEAVHFEAQSDANDANAGIEVDSDADAEYETDPEYLPISFWHGE